MRCCRVSSAVGFPFLAATLAVVSLLVGSCAPSAPVEAADPGIEWAIVIHGGAGAKPEDVSAERTAAVETAVATALDEGRKRLDAGESALDVVEAVIRIMEDDPAFNAGRGAVLNAAGVHELDASIMDGRDKSCGAVAGVRTVRNPISLARRVMTETRHVLLASDGAEAFADEQGVERVDNEWFTLEDRRRSLERVLEKRQREADEKKGTVGVVARDRDGNLAAGTSTGGLTAKQWGRVGDSPIVGAGTYADNATCAVSGTGVGEEYIRHGIARTIAALMEYRDWDLQRAVDHAMNDILEPNVGGVIAVDVDGTLAWGWNTRDMLRGRADSTGLREVVGWE